MCEAPSTWRARMCLIEPRFFRAEYSGLIAAPGTPNAQTTPSLSSTRTAASIARIFAISHLDHVVSGASVARRAGDLNPVRLIFHDVGWPAETAGISGDRAVFGVKRA